MLSEMEETAQVSSSAWLQSFGLSKKKLTMPKILARLGFQQREDYVNKLGRPVSSRYSHGLFRQYTSNGKIYNLIAKREEVLQKIESITNIIELYNRRLDWLNSSSRSVFGVIQERSVVIILDLNASTKVQHSLCQDALCLVIKEQIAHISKFNLIWVSQEPVKWHQKIIRVTQHSIEEAAEWIRNLQQSPVANVDSAAEAVSEALEDQVEAIYYFSAGDTPVANIQKLKQSIENSSYPLHVVCYNPYKTKTITLLNELSHQTSGRFHVYFEKNKEEDMKKNQSNGYPDMPEPSNDLPELDVRKEELLIRNELSQAQENLKQLQDIWKTFYHSEDEKDNMVEETSEDCASSKEWLKKFGLKPQKLLFYDALADCAFRHSDGVVDIKIKPEDESLQTDAENNMKLINAKYCDHFVHVLWKDGAVVHVHISKEKCRWYEEKMKTALDQISRRVKWLQKGSRELFGTILEDQVYILIDTSHSMKDKLFLVKEKILQLLQEQLKHKRMFNFVKFDSNVEAWKPKLAEVNEEHIKEAWCWIRELQVGSSTNTLKALEVALTDSNTQAVYLLTDGRPDQPIDTILDEVNILSKVPIHTISFNCDDTEANNFLYELSSKTGGRFHTYSSHRLDADAPQPFVSEDIQLLLDEIEEGKSTLEKIKKLHLDCLMLDWYHNGETVLTQRTLQKQSYTSPPRLQSAHELRSSSSSLLHRSSLSPPRLLRRKKTRHAEQTRSSLLRALSHGVRLSENVTDLHTPPETSKLSLNIDKKTASVLKEMNLIDSSKVQAKVKKLPKNSLDISSSRWLKTYGLVPRRLTIMDALAPTTVPHSATYIPILDKHVVSKVFDEVLPLAHISGNRKLITLINPQAVNLSDYKERLQRAIESYKRRLNLIVWRALSQEERDNFDSDVPISYLDNKEALLQALDRLGWPIPTEDVMLLEDEIHAGKTYLKQALDLQEITSKKALTENTDKQMNREELEKFKKKHKSKNFLDTLRGQKVIARSEIDGFYYPGTVLKSINPRTALVDFWLGENEVVPIRFIIQTGGALPWPILKVGDCVFSKTGARGGGGCYVPAVVIATPRTDAADKLYTVLKYDKRKEHCLRSELIKITPSQFAVSCGYIRKAQMIDFTIPSVQLAKPLLRPTPPKEEKKPRSVCRRRKRSVIQDLKPRTPSDSDSLASTDSADQERNLVHQNILNKLEDLALRVTQYQNEQKENQKAIHVFIKELKEHRSHQDASHLQEEEKQIEKQKINLVEQLKLPIPIRNTEKEKNESLVLNNDHPLLPGQKVLCVCSHNGWYEEGSIIHDCGDLTYFIEKPSGEVVRIHRDDLLTDADDFKEIEENDPVIGPHPLHPGSYCPGVVLNCTLDLKVTVRYYDSTEAFAPREHIYSISPEKYKRDTSYILECVERWVGQPVVARNDETGTFHLAEVKKLTDNHKEYVISWADGTTTIQDMEWIFGKFSQPHVLKVGSHVLTLAYPSSLTFLPGIITAINGTALQILFCNGKRCQNMEAHHCFGLTEKTYDGAVQLYYINNPTILSDDDHSSENEDTLSDVSSFTISSVDSQK